MVLQEQRLLAGTVPNQLTLELTVLQHRHESGKLCNYWQQYRCVCGVVIEVLQVCAQHHLMLYSSLCPFEVCSQFLPLMLRGFKDSMFIKPVVVRTKKKKKKKPEDATRNAANCSDDRSTIGQNLVRKPSESQQEKCTGSYPVSYTRTRKAAFVHAPIYFSDHSDTTYTTAYICKVCCLTVSLPIFFKAAPSWLFFFFMFAQWKFNA